MHRCVSVVVLLLGVTSSFGDVGVDSQVNRVFTSFYQNRLPKVHRLAPFVSLIDPVALLPGIRTTCQEGLVMAPPMRGRSGNFMSVVNETRTVLQMKVRSDEAHFSFPNCTVESTTDMIPGFSGFDIELEGVMKDSDFNIQLTLDHLPTCNVTVNEVHLVDMSRISFKIFEGVLPKMLGDQISKFLAKYNRKLMDDCVVKAVEETVAQLSDVIDLCEIFHPNLRANDEL